MSIGDTSKSHKGRSGSFLKTISFWLDSGAISNFVGGNLDFTLIKKFIKVCSDVLTCTKIEAKLFLAKMYSKTVFWICKWPIFAVLTQGEFYNF